MIPMMQYAAERFLYLPSVGWVVALAWGMMRLLERFPRLMVGLAVVPSLWAVVAFQRAGVWKDDLTRFLPEAGTLSPRTGARREDYQAMEKVLESVADRL